MKKTTMAIILSILFAICLIVTALSIYYKAAAWAALGGFAVSAYSGLVALLFLRTDIFPFIKEDDIEDKEEKENYRNENFVVNVFDNNEVYIMCNNVVRHAITGEDLYHGMSFNDCKIWCKSHNYYIINDIW